MSGVTEHPFAAYRKAKGLSRAEIAQQLGITEAMVGHIERGVRKASAERAKEWQREHGIPAHVTRPDLFEQAAA
jgi:transcriptional regulator with XRE-family HTH domain